MPKLYASIDIDLDFGPIQAIVINEHRILKPHEIHRIVEKSSRSEFTLAVTIHDKEDRRTAVCFDMIPNRNKNTAVFEWIIDQDSGMAHVKAHGGFESLPLRPGVADYIEELGRSEANLQLDAFNLRHGKWKGFEAPVKKEDGAPFDDQTRIKIWTVK